MRATTRPMLPIGTRVVVAQHGFHKAKRGVVAKHNKYKDVATRKWMNQQRVDFDDGGDRWFKLPSDLVLEDSDEAKLLITAYEESLGTPDLQADLEAGRAVTDPLAVREARDRVRRHSDPGVVDVLLHLGELELSRMHTQVPHGVPAPAHLALAEIDVDAIPAVTAKLDEWFADPKKSKWCRSLSRAFTTSPADPRLLETLRRLSKAGPDRRILAARLDARDPEVYGDLAAVRIVERDGRVELDAGDLDPEAVDEMLKAAGDRGESVAQLNVAQGGLAAFGAIDLEAWLEWEGLRRFPRLNFGEVLTKNKEHIAALVASPNLSPELQALDLSGCEISTAMCSVLGKASTLSTLRELRLEHNEHSRKQPGERALAGLFPAKGGTLHAVEHLDLSLWKITQAQVNKIVQAGRAPALKTVSLGHKTLAFGD